MTLTVEGTTDVRAVTVPPPVVGGYDIGNIRFNLTRRPHWLARFLCRVLLDWHWKDAR